MANNRHKMGHNFKRKQRGNPNQSLNLFQVTDLVTALQNGQTSKVDRISSIRTSNTNVYYVLLNDPSVSYVMHPNMCYRIKMICYSKRWQVQIGGFRCFQQTVKLSTCFDYNSSIKFILNDEEAVLDLSDLDLVKNELADNYGEFLAFSEANLLLGQAILLRVEIDQTAVCQYKLVLEYLLKSSVHPSSHPRIDQNWAISSQFSLDSIVKTNAIYSQLNDRMDEIFDTLKISSGDVVLVCGASNCGKSSLVHHLINRYISTPGDIAPKSVYYLECDPGQTEFSPCGILSLVAIDECILSPPGFKFLSCNRTLLTQSGRMISKIFGTTSPSDCGAKYINLIHQLFQHFIELKTRSPLFINTMGWIEGLGLELLLKIVHFSRPTHLVRVQSNNENLISPSYSIQNIERLFAKRSSFSRDISSLLDMMKKIPFKFYYTSACVADTFRWSPFRSSGLRREINQLSYLASTLWTDISYLPFYSIKPTKLSLSNLYVHFMSNPRICPYLIYDLLNASWVILGHVNYDEMPNTTKSSSLSIQVKQEQTDELTSIRLIPEIPNNATCLGCGIVRTIDCRENCIYVIIPRALSHWHDTGLSGGGENIAHSGGLNLIVLPDLISIPSGLLNEQFLYQSSSSLPYIFSYFEPK